MRSLIAAAREAPPPRGAVAVVAVGLLASLLAALLARDSAATGADVPWTFEKDFASSPVTEFGPDGEMRISSGALSATDANEEEVRLYKVEASLGVRAPSGAALEQARCEARAGNGVFIGKSEGRRAAFPRPLEDSADDAIREGAPVEFETSEDELAGIELRNSFFSYVKGGDPSVEWPLLVERRHAWLWKYPEPVEKAEANFAIIWFSRGGPTVTVECEATAGADSARTATEVVLPRDPGLQQRTKPRRPPAESGAG